MPIVVPRLWSQPLRWARYHAHENPALFWSVAIGSTSPIFLFAVPPIRRRLGYMNTETPPLTYPIPPGPRKIPEGFDD